jgi:hypothetical protein
MDADLPFYYWTSNERFRDEEQPSFNKSPGDDDDDDPTHHHLRLHRL